MENEPTCLYLKVEFLHESNFFMATYIKKKRILKTLPS